MIRTVTMPRIAAICVGVSSAEDAAMVFTTRPPMQQKARAKRLCAVRDFENPTYRVQVCKMNIVELR